MQSPRSGPRRAAVGELERVLEGAAPFRDVPAGRPEPPERGDETQHQLAVAGLAGEADGRAEVRVVVVEPGEAVVPVADPRLDIEPLRLVRVPERVAPPRLVGLAGGLQHLEAELADRLEHPEARLAVRVAPPRAGLGRQ